MCVYLLDISSIVNVSRELATKYQIVGNINNNGASGGGANNKSIENACETNMKLAVLAKHYDIAKVYSTQGLLARSSQQFS